MPGLVTVLTRTLGRPCLPDAAASVAAQSWRPIEWLVVDAAGTGITAPPAGDVEVRVIGSGDPMLRARAANFAFGHVRGARVLILDDDDLLMPRAIEVLSAALDANPDARVAYGDVNVDSGEPGGGGQYAVDYSELLITQRNLFPPNAALFDVSLIRDDGIRFDEDLNWYEDWDLWLAMSARTRFVRVPEVTGIYRLVLSQSGVWNTGHPDADPRMREHFARVHRRGAGRRARLQAQMDAMKADARRLAGAGRLPEAAARWQEAHVFYRFDPEPYLGTAEVAWAAGDRAAAGAAVGNAIAMFPRESVVHRAHARLLDLLGDPDGARAALARAAELEAGREAAP